MVGVDSQSDDLQDAMYGHLDVAMSSGEKAKQCRLAGDHRQADVYDGMSNEHSRAAFGLERRLREHPA